MAKLLETYEWDELWWEHAEDSEKPRVLIIGDSISGPYKNEVNRLAGGKYYADRVGTSKAIDNLSLYKLVEYYMSQSCGVRVIQFNNGLHGWHLGVEEYGRYYHLFVNWLREKYPDKELMLALTTPVDAAKRPGEIEIVRARNDAVRRIAAEESLYVNDLYKVVSDISDIENAHSPDGIHLTDEAYKTVARHCAGIYGKIFNL